MERGISEKSKQLRRHLLNHNARDVIRRMRESGLNDPVGMIIEMTDDIGKQLTFAVHEKQSVPRHEILELIASYCKNAIPAFKMRRQLRDRKEVKWTPVFGPLHKVDPSDLELKTRSGLSWQFKEKKDATHPSPF